MKKKKTLLIVIPVACVLIAAVIVGAVLLISSQKKEDRYYEQMQAAKRYLSEENYEKMVSAYEMAIELKPEDPDAYIGLAEYYLEAGEYYEAKSIARTGLLKTNNKRLQDLIILIDDTREEQFQQTEDVVAVDTEAVSQENMDSVLVRNDVIGMVAEYCYQQYANTYKQVDVKYVSSEDGCQVRFKGMEMYAYFKNDASHSNMVDSYSKKPTKTAKPYKVEIMKPSVLFVGFDGYITSERIAEMFNIEPANVIEQEGDSYFLVFDYLGCTVKIETDQKGNLCDGDALIELYPLDLDSDWEEEEEEEEEEETDDGTFVLAGETYTYDVESIYIYNATLNNIEPLYECKKLKSVMFINCSIADLSPLAGCTALQELNLQDSTGDLDLSCLSGLSSLKYLGFHECTDIDDLSPIMNLDLYLLHPCGSSVPYEQVEEYMNRHPGCEVWFDYYCIS